MTTLVGDPQNVAAWLPEMAARQPDTLAVAAALSPGQYQQWTAAELDAQCDRTAHGLTRAGIGKGTRTVVMLKPGPEFFAVAFALFKIGAIPVLVDPGMGIRSLGHCLNEAAPTAFIGVPRAHLARQMFGWSKASLEVLITAGPRLLWGGYKLDKLYQTASHEAFPVDDSEPDQTAAILFTSGSTGTPKGVVYTHSTFASQVETLRTVYGITPGEVDLSTFPLFALFGPALGMASVVPLMDASRPASCDPRQLVEAIKKFSCTSMFASPALVDKLGRHCDQQSIRLDSLLRVISAGAPANNNALALLAEHLPADSEIFTPYGATEALPVTSIASSVILGETRDSTDLGRGACVGTAVPGVEVAIVPISDGVMETWRDDLRLPAGEIGEIVVRGPVVTTSYFGRPEATAMAKIPDGATTWHRMGDVGYLDEFDRLWMCGRKTHRVETDTETLFTIPCEAVFNVHRAVRRTALVGVHGSPVLCVELEQDHTESPELSEELQRLGQTQAHTRGIEVFLYHPKFPVDVRHNTKIFRERLAVWAGERLRA